MTPYERAMGSAIAAALQVSVEEAEAYAAEARRQLEAGRSTVTGTMFAIMEMGAETATAFAAFRRAIGDAGEQASQRGIIG